MVVQVQGDRLRSADQIVANSKAIFEYFPICLMSRWHIASTDSLFNNRK